MRALVIVCAVLALLTSTARAQECLNARIVAPSGDTNRTYDLGDANGDGHLDLLGGYTQLGRRGANSESFVTVSLGDGRGRFAPPSRASVGRRNSSATFADVNGDGREDVLAAGYTERRLVIFISRPDGTLRRRGAIRLPQRPYSVSAHDVNGDGHADALVTARDGLRVLLGNGRGRFRLRATIHEGVDPELPVVRDFDGDGKLDLLLVHNDTNNAVFLHGRGDGTFEKRGEVPDLCDGPYTAIAGDFDADGRLDAAYGCVRSNGLRWFPAVGPNLRDGGTIGTIPNGTWLETADITGNGRVDIVATPNIGRNLELLIPDAQGAFVSRARVALGSQHLLRPLVGDVDEDGRADIVLVVIGQRGNPHTVQTYVGAACDAQLPPPPPARVHRGLRPANPPPPPRSAPRQRPR